MPSLGDTLRDRRMELGASLEEAERATRIRGRLIRALEDGEYDRLPNPGYVRGYISSYARFLGLDSAPLLAMYRAETGASRIPTELDLPRAREAVPRGDRPHALPARTYMLLAAAVAVVGLLAFGISRCGREPESLPPLTDTAVEETETVPATDTAVPATTTAPVTTETVPTETDVAQPFKVEVSVDDDGASWLRITVDGLKAYEGILAGGQSKSYDVTERVEIRIGQPSSVTVLRDGTVVEIPTAQDTPTLVLTADPND